MQSPISLLYHTFIARDVILQAFTDGELSASRQALRYIIRNTTLPQRMRAQAQLKLATMHCYTRSTQIKNRCIMGGKGRGVLSDFRMARVRSIVTAVCVITSLQD